GGAFGLQKVQHGVWRAGRGEQREPGAEIHFAVTRLLEGRHVGQGCRRFASGDGQCAHFAALDLRGRERGGDERGLYAAGYQGRHRIARVAVVHRFDLYARFAREQFGSEVAGRACAEGAEVDAVIRLLAGGDEGLQVFVGRIGGHHQHEVHAHHFRDRREVFGGVVVQIAVGGGRNTD